MNKFLAVVLVALVLVSTAAGAEVTAQVGVRIQAQDFRVTDTGKVTERPELAEARYFSAGVLASYPQSDLVIRREGTLAPGASVSIDLRGSLINTFGETASFAKVRALMVVNVATTALTLAGDPAAPAGAFFSIATGGVIIPGSGTVALVAPIVGYSIGSGTSDLLGISNAAGGTGSYRLIILGNSQ